jgi:hypothetical protein
LNNCTRLKIIFAIFDDEGRVPVCCKHVNEILYREQLYQLQDRRYHTFEIYCTISVMVVERCNVPLVALTVTVLLSVGVP